MNLVSCKLIDVSVADIGEIKQINDLTIRDVQSVVAGNMPLFPPAPRDWSQSS